MLATSILALRFAAASSQVDPTPLRTWALIAFVCAALLIAEAGAWALIWRRTSRRSWIAFLPVLVFFSAGMWAVVVGWQSAMRYQQITAAIQRVIASCGGNSRCPPAPIVLTYIDRIASSVQHAMMQAIIICAIAAIGGVLSVMALRRLLNLPLTPQPAANGLRQSSTI